MSTPYEEKGKIFTPVISKREFPVIIQTRTNRVQGRIHLREDESVKDAVNTSIDFIAVTQVEIFNVDGKESLVKTDFLALNRRNIIWVIEDHKGSANG